MDPPFGTPVNTVTVDEDLAEQAHPGHGIPSQDPAAAAQFRLQPEEAEREANSELMGGGVVTGMATGPAAGVVVSGPVGVVVGGTLGALVGAWGAAAAGNMVMPGDTRNGDTARAAAARLQSGNSSSGEQPQRSGPTVD